MIAQQLAISHPQVVASLTSAAIVAFVGRTDAREPPLDRIRLERDDTQRTIVRLHFVANLFQRSFTAAGG